MNRGIKILLADRNGNVRTFLKRFFQDEGYEVEDAGSADELLRLIEDDEVFYFLLMDIDLPTMDGINLLGNLKNRIPQIPVVIHSSHTELKGHPDLAYAKDFIEKGEDLALLKERVMELVERELLGR